MSSRLLFASDGPPQFGASPAHAKGPITTGCGDGSFAMGAAIPLLVFALAGRRVAERVRSFRKHQQGIRVTGGIVMIALAIGLIFNLPQILQTANPDYTSALQAQFSNSSQVSTALDLGGLVNSENKDLSKCREGATKLESCGNINHSDGARRNRDDQLHRERQDQDLSGLG